MAFPFNLTSKMTGATPSQLKLWRSRGLIVPEVQGYNPPLYSFRDLVALRSIVYLRSSNSLQKIDKAFKTLDLIDLTEHPASYKFGTDGKTIFVDDGHGETIDLLNVSGQQVFSFADMFISFPNFKDVLVPDFRRPAPEITTNPKVLGGFPAIENTRIPYTLVAQLMEDDSVSAQDVEHYYPGVSVAAATSAFEFNRDVESVA